MFDMPECFRYSSICSSENTLVPMSRPTVIYRCVIHFWLGDPCLVGGFSPATPLKNDGFNVSWDDEIRNSKDFFWKNENKKKCSKTFNQIF